MNNSQISDRIKRLADMMSLLEENPFKIKSFQNAARIIRDHDEAMGVLVDEDRLKDVPGVGKTLAYVIMYYAKAGTVGLEQELEAQLPEGLPDLMDLPGLGLKKVQILWQQHAITTLTMLKQACETNALLNMKGFGPHLQAKLVEAIAFQESHARDFYLDMTLAVAHAWVEKLEPLQCMNRIELTGTLRRGDSLVQSIDFLVESDLSAFVTELNDQFQCGLSPEEPLIIVDKSGIPIHFWVSTPEAFEAQQLIRTGGDAFSETLRAEYGSDVEVAIAALTQPLGFPSEKALCESIDIQWIEPELRDLYSHYPDVDELIESHHIKGAFHAHSTWSDGRNSLEEMVLASRALGYHYLGISEHSQAAYYANGLKPDRVKAQWDRIDALNDQYQDFHIFKGIEADILNDGRLDYDEELLAGFDFVIASIHSHFHLDPVRQTDRIVRALQSPFTTILGHPTGRMLMARSGYNPDLRTLIDVAAENDKFIEINTTPKRLDLDWKYLKYAREKGLHISIDPDAHSVKGLETIPLGVQMARKGGITSNEVLNTLSTGDMKTYLRNRRVL